MSSGVLLRDDHQDNMFASDAAAAGVFVRFEDVLRLSEAVWQAVLTVGADAATATDGSGGEAGLPAFDAAVAADAVFSRSDGVLPVREAAAVSDGIFSPVVSIASSAAQSGADALTAAAAQAAAAAALSDGAFAAAVSAAAAADGVRVSDAADAAAGLALADAAALSDAPVCGAAAWAGAEDAAAVSDVLGLSSSVFGVVVSQGRASDGTASHLDALLEAEDAVEADGGCVRDAGARFEALAWTANTDNWAVSRYLLDGWRGLAVVDGVLLGLSDEGVFVLDKDAGKGAEAVSASVCTGKADIGQGVLAHPLGAYMEYALRGNAEMLVSTTQDGTVKTYPYRLVDGKTDELTNGRFVFGRGLRGRHFTFELRLSGASAHIHDWRIDAAAVKRRI
ncbi:hypothetical protein [Neisseria polysaccharea]|uniref:hypothetical protein n=1 Tax=Neisseria polysaccharea TaxID=489 RepID=UPI0027E1DB80|nr:hypothetical protein [Neisseria polysaccharea]